MTDRQEDQLSMMRTLLAIRVIYAVQIAAVADVDADFEDLETEVNAIKTLLPKQKLQTTGIARDKADVVEDLVEAATIVSGAVMAFASKNGNNTLFDEVKYTQSTLEHLRDEVLPDTCRIIHGRANDNLAALAGRGITALVLTGFMDLIEELEGMTEAPRTATTQKSTATVEMAEHFTEGMKIVKERLDGGMKIFKTTLPELYTTYKNGRKIVNTGKKKKTDTETGELVYHVTDDANNPLNEAIVGVDDRISTTDDAGKGKFKGLTPGNKMVAFFKPGFLEKFEPVVITKGEVTNVSTQLTPGVSSGNTGKIAGNVKQMGVGVSATVSVQGTGLSVTTDPMGNFIINDVPEGAQIIVAFLNSNPANTQPQNATVIADATVSVNFNFP